MQMHAKYLNVMSKHIASQSMLEMLRGVCRKSHGTYSARQAVRTRERTVPVTATDVVMNP